MRRTEYTTGYLGDHPEAVTRNCNMYAERGWKFVSMSWYPIRNTFLGVFTREVEGE